MKKSKFNDRRLSLHWKSFLTTLRPYRPSTKRTELKMEPGTQSAFLVRQHP